MSVRSAVQLAQAILAGAGAHIEQDGKLGRETVSAYERASTPIRDQVREAVQFNEALDWDSLVSNWKRRSAVKTEPIKSVSVDSGVRARTKQTRPTRTSVTGSFKVKPVKFISSRDAVALARRFNSAANLPEGTMEFMLNIEAERMSGGYNASARGGSGKRYLGLYQFFDNAAYAWADGTRNALTFGFRVAPMYPEGWMDPEHNTACAAGYAVMNRSLLKRAGLPVTKETLYACHQQGAGAFIASVKNREVAIAGPQSGAGSQAVRKAHELAIV